MCSQSAASSKAKASKQTKHTNMSDTEDDYLLTGRVARKMTAPQKVGAQKFTQGTKAYQKLKKLFEDKAILPTDKPSDIRQKDTLFQDFTNQQFRSQFNKLKAIHGTCTKEGTFTEMSMLMSMLLSNNVLTLLSYVNRLSATREG
jgi:hypothetical protein